MEFSSFTFILTEECNFNCSYCYQKKGKKTLDVSTIEKTLDFFFPFLAEGCWINFSGGEPLLAFDLIRRAVDYIQVKGSSQKKKQLHYNIATNGSLISDEILDFLKQYKFSLLLSFDGLAQDICRKKGSLKQIGDTFDKLIHPDINLEVNSVFTPKSIGYLSKSIQFIIEQGAPHILFSLSINSSWNHSSLIQLEKELDTLRGFVLPFYKKRGIIPLSCFRGGPSKGIFACFAGLDRMTLTPDGKLWGCYLFSDYFKEREGTPEYEKYCFGNLDEFIKNHEMIYPEIIKNYSNLRMDFFYTDDGFCSQCPELEECVICPVSAAFSSSIIGKISGWTCKSKKIIRKERELFWREWENMK